MNCTSLEEFKEKVQESYEREIEQMYPYLVDIADVIVQNDDDAQDVVQNAFVRLLASQQGYDPSKGATLKTWVTTRVISKAKDFLRRRTFEGEYFMPLEEEQSDEMSSHDSTYDRIEQTCDVSKALDQLPPDERLVMKLRWEDGLEHAEIANRHYNGFPGRVDRVYRRAKKHLRPILLAYESHKGRKINVEKATTKVA